VIEIIKSSPKKKLLRVKVYWDNKLIISQSKHFYEKTEAFKEIVWIFKSALTLTEGKATFDELSVKKGDFEKNESG